MSNCQCQSIDIVMMIVLFILLLSIHYTLSYHYHLRYDTSRCFQLYNNNNNEKSNTIKYPTITSRRDLFYSSDQYLPTSDSLFENDVNIPKGLEKLEPTELIRNDNDDDDSDIIQVDKFRFKVNANDLKKAIEMKTSLDTKQISSTNDDINDVNLKLSPEMVELLSKIDIEEIDGMKKISLRIDSSELDSFVNNNDNSVINDDDIYDDDDDDDIDNNDDDGIDEVIYKYNNKNVNKSIKPATFYGDESQLASFKERNRNTSPISSAKESLSKVSWWLGGVGKYELSSDMIGTAVIMLGLSIILTTFDAVAKSLQKLSVSAIMKAIQLLKIEKFMQKKFVPVCLIGCALSTLLKKYVQMRQDHKYDGIGYRVNR